MTTYRTVLPAPDGRFYGVQQDNRRNVPGGWSAAPRTITYVPVEECVEKIREVGYAYLRPNGEIVVEFETDDPYELAVTVKDLESELNAYQYWQTPLIIERPVPVSVNGIKAAKKGGVRTGSR